MSTHFLTLFMLLGYSFGFSQEIISFNTTFSNSFKDWTFDFIEDSFDENTSIIDGQISLTWSIANQWDEYSVTLEGFRSGIKRNAIGTMLSFELTNDSNERVTANRIWPRDLSAWKVDYDGVSYEIRLLYPDDPEEWIIQTENQTLCNILTEFRGDPRYWILDYKSETLIPKEIQKLAVVIIIHITCPKF